VDRTVTPHDGKQVDVHAPGHKNVETEDRVPRIVTESETSEKKIKNQGESTTVRIKSQVVDRTVTPHDGKQVDVHAPGHKNVETEDRVPRIVTESETSEKKIKNQGESTTVRIKSQVVDRTVTPHDGKQVDVHAPGHKNDETEVIQNVESIILVTILAPEAVIVTQQFVELMSHECTTHRRNIEANVTVPKSFCNRSAWLNFKGKAGLNVSDSKFFDAILTSPILAVGSIDKLPIAKPDPTSITTFTDPSTNVQVICLPISLPDSRVIGSHVVYVRPFNIGIIKAMISSMARNIVVVGNAGIGKSYMQLVILLWWARRELRPDDDIFNEFFDGIDAIARVERDNQTDIFFKSDKRHYRIEHRDRLPLLSSLNSKSTLLLYEPRVCKEEIEDCGICLGRVWATVSPLPARYKEFSKTDCGVSYMACANEEELLNFTSLLLFLNGFNHLAHSNESSCRQVCML
ncbi:hypothetical protein As57867_016694, partial [Aphanomyces stellatus]